jgi:hypothetical protein
LGVPIFLLQIDRPLALVVEVGPFSVVKLSLEKPFAIDGCSQHGGRIWSIAEAEQEIRVPVNGLSILLSQHRVARRRYLFELLPVNDRLPQMKEQVEDNCLPLEPPDLQTAIALIPMKFFRIWEAVLAAPLQNLMRRHVIVHRVTGLRLLHETQEREQQGVREFRQSLAGLDDPRRPLIRCSFPARLIPRMRTQP